MHREDTSPKAILLYGVGGVGQTVARLAAARHWPVAAAVNREGAKVGRDLGELTGSAGLAGIRVADSADTDFSTIGADIAIVALHDRLEHTFPHHRRLLEAGINVICVGGESSYPAAVDAGIATELDHIAKANGVTFTGCGLWDSYRIWTVKTLAGPCTALRKLHHRSVTDANRFGPEVIRLARIGEDPETFATADSAGGADKSIYRVFMHQVAASLGLAVVRVAERQEPIRFDEAVACPALGRVVEPGLCVGTRAVIEVETKEGVAALADVELRLIREGAGEWMSWTVDGDPPAEMRLQGLDTGHATASSVVNRIPDVLAAPPGLVTVDRMAPMRFCAGQPEFALAPPATRLAG
jgi:4-hydroxy-tetrahydrodipicolinate reductase